MSFELGDSSISASVAVEFADASGVALGGGVGAVVSVSVVVGTVASSAASSPVKFVPVISNSFCFSVLVVAVAVVAVDASDITESVVCVFPCIFGWDGVVVGNFFYPRPPRPCPLPRPRARPGDVTLLVFRLGVDFLRSFVAF